MPSFVLPKMLIVLDLGHQLGIQLDSLVRRPKHVLIVEEAWVQRPQYVRIRFGRMLILI